MFLDWEAAMVTAAPPIQKMDHLEIKKWLNWFAFDAEDRRYAQLLQDEVTRPNADRILDDFLHELYKHEAFAQAVSRFSADELRQMLLAGLVDLGHGFDSPEYFQARLSAGTFYAASETPLRFYPAACTLLQECILRYIPARLKQDIATYERLVLFILKITSLGASLAIEAYHRAKLLDLEHSIHQLRAEVIEWQRLAKTDDLTKIANRWEILEALRRWSQIALHQHTPLCLLMADIDFFKQVNDAWGHLAGDTVLQHVTRRIQSALRPIDVVGRYGGEEFLIILPETTHATARKIAERIRSRVAACPVHHDGKDIYVTISIGISSFDENPDIFNLIAHADAAMYRAKDDGRNRVAVYANA